MLPDPYDVLETTLGPASRTAGLEDRRVVRTTGREDHPAGSAVHHAAPLDEQSVRTAVADLDERFPTGRARLVAPLAGRVPTVPDMVPSVVQVLRRAAAPGPAPRSDVHLAPPADDRAWHGITVLHRHAAPPGEDRARGAQDERLQWWVDGLRELVGSGRARVLRAERFGTPVGVGVLHWAPGLPVDGDHAGLAVVADVVVHPAHRRLGIGRTIVERLVADHLQDFPRARVMAVADHAGATTAPPPPDGWEEHAALAVLTRPERRTDEAHR